MSMTQDEIDNILQDAFSDTLKQTEIKTKQKSNYFCSSCDNPTLINDSMNGIIVCTTCGVIEHDRVIDESPEWSFGAEDAASGSKDPARCGMPTSEFFPKSGCSTIITGGKNNTLMKRLHMQMSMDYVERSRYHLFNKIGKMCSELSPIILNTTKYLYLDIEKLKLSRGNIRKGLIACCIFYACKQHKMSRSVKEIASICEIEPSVVNNANKIFQDLMSTHYIAKYFRESTEIDDLISRFCTYITINRKQTCDIIKIIKPINTIVEETQILIGKTPSAITAAYILYATQKIDINISKKIISEKLDVSIVTINKIMQTLNDNSNLFN